jgi:hypothetical protein
MELLLQFKAYLANLYETQAPLYFLLLVITINVGTWVSRKAVPWFWSTLELDNPTGSKLLQSLPVVLAGIVLHGLGGAGVDVAAFWGAVFSALAIVLHHLVKAWNWGPAKLYQGELGTLIPKLLGWLAKRVRGAPTLIVLLLAGCAGAMCPACGTPAAKYVDPACEREIGLLDAARVAETEACTTPKCVDEVQKRYDEKVDAACGGAQ